LASKTLDLTVGEWNETIALEEIENTLAQQVHDNADMASEIETVPQVDAAVPIFLVVGFQGGKNPQLYTRGIAVLLYGANDLDGNWPVSSTVSSLDDFAKRSLAEEFHHLILRATSVSIVIETARRGIVVHLSVRFVSGTTM
jgi:hypothetical protein